MNEEIESMRTDGSIKNIAKLDAADEFTGCLLDNGMLYVWGKNDRGQLGVGSGIGIDFIESENIPLPIVLENGKKIKDVHCG